MVLSGLCYLLLALAGVLGLGFGARLEAWAAGGGLLLGMGAALLGAASRGAGPGLWAALGAAAAAGALVALAFRE